ncbi:MAG: UvrD-helicase domain-containing protein [Flavobacteriaceae bacterium]
METPTPFLVYNASAGSGKTFVLVKTFLKKILSNPQKDYYKHLLAITFTNKAVSEMKERIIRTLIDFSSEVIPERSTNLLNSIIQETTLPHTEIKVRSHKVLRHLLNHYALFSVETIDHFNLRLLRTFARDLKLPPHFEVSLETPLLISKAIDKLIEKAGKDNEITALLIDFALQKTEEDKSWNIALDLNKTAKLVAIENDLPYLEKLKSKSISDFKKLQKELYTTKKEWEEKAIHEARLMMQTFNFQGLERTHFSRGSVFDFFSKITERDLAINFTPAWHLKIDTTPLYKKNEDAAIAQKIDVLVSTINEAFFRICDAVAQIQLIENILKNLVPLATVNLIQQELDKIKEEEGILPISDFNRIISNEIKNEPAPYIYERLGERYRHFFIDEFQDTSQLQWQNLIPLVENALAQNFTHENGSLLLVGDAKQSIYRWRGGLPEQFIDLCTCKNPFPSVKKEVLNLETNFRSCEEIINFNNSFFTFIARFFGNSDYQKIYEIGNKQQKNTPCKGSVTINFIDSILAEDASQEYVQKVLETVQELEKRGCPKKDICILTRKKDEGIAVSEFLIANGVSVVSEETLLLQNSEIVQLLIHLLQLSLSPRQDDVKIFILEFLYSHIEVTESKHSFFLEQVGAPLSTLETKLKEYNMDLSFKKIQSLPLYESLEYLIYALNLSTKADAYLMHFMDWVFQYTQRPQTGKQDFLTYWEAQKEQISLSLNSVQENTIKVMTIHKSKGLEFPVVIFPFADLEIYKEVEPKAWYPWQKDGFEALLINYSGQVDNYGEIGRELSQKRRNTLELDNINLLYVAFTRAKKELHVFAKKEPFKDAPKKYNHFLKLFLENNHLWQEDLKQFTFGQKSSWKHSKKREENPFIKPYYPVSLPYQSLLQLAATNTLLFSEEQQEAIHFGNIVHQTMAHIAVIDDLPFALEELKKKSLPKEEIQKIEKTISKILQHPKVNPLFSSNDIIYTEKEIISAQGILRPDRINIHPNQAITILDYKTGLENSSHVHQINNYAQVLSEMGFVIKEKLLVYIEKETIFINNI